MEFKQPILLGIGTALFSDKRLAFDDLRNSDIRRPRNLSNQETGKVDDITDCQHRFCAHADMSPTVKPRQIRLQSSQYQAVV